MSKVLVNESSLTGIADAIRGKNGSTTTYKPSEMAAAITAISGGSGPEIPESAFVLSGSCMYRFANSAWDWFINLYGNKITTENITNTQYMFYNCSLSNIPFEININDNTSISYMFSLSKIKTLPYINGKVENAANLFNKCKYLNSIQEDWAEHINWDYVHSNQNIRLSSMFSDCYSLRHIPDSLITEIWGVNGSNNFYVAYYNQFYSCYSLDEVNNIMPQQATMSSDRCNSMFTYCTRLKNATFALQDNGTPYTVSWKTQKIDLSNHVGYAQPNKKVSILNYNSGITADKEVTDDATYQALKDDPDWFTTKVEYSRYNHDSAVATINSLPDTSAYLATAGGTNTIKFKSAAGSATDGGAISSLTPEEIAVATAKGWTVSFV